MMRHKFVSHRNNAFFILCCFLLLKRMGAVNKTSRLLAKCVKGYRALRDS
jgi:hypothetical protein